MYTSERKFYNATGVFECKRMAVNARFIHNGYPRRISTSFVLLDNRNIYLTRNIESKGKNEPWNGFIGKLILDIFVWQARGIRLNEFILSPVTNKIDDQFCIFKCIMVFKKSSDAICFRVNLGI